MNAKDISEQKFDKSAFGYKVDEVDAYLDQVAKTLGELTAQNAELQNKLEILAAKVEEYRQDENSMREALIGAQRLGNNMLKEAREKAEQIISEAQEKGDALLREATESSKKTLASMKKDIEREQHTLLLTQREVSNFKSKLLALYKSHLDTITSIPEIKEKDSEAVESISSKLTNSTPEEEPAVSETPAAEPMPESRAAEVPAETVPESSEESVSIQTSFSERFGGPLGAGESQKSSLESKFGELRFGRNVKK